MFTYTITQDNGPHRVVGTGFTNRAHALRSVSHALRDGRMVPTGDALAVMERLAGSDTAGARDWWVEVVAE